MNGIDKIGHPKSFGEMQQLSREGADAARGTRRGWVKLADELQGTLEAGLGARLPQEEAHRLAGEIHQAATDVARALYRLEEALRELAAAAPVQGEARAATGPQPGTFKV